MSTTDEELKEIPDSIKEIKNSMSVLSELLQKQVEMGNKLTKNWQPLFKQYGMLKSQMATVDEISNIAESITKVQNDFKTAICIPEMQQMYKELSAVPRFNIAFSNNQMVLEMQSLIKSEAFQKDALELQKAYDSISVFHTSPVIKWVQSFNLAPLFEKLKEYPIPEFDFEKIIKVCLHEMYKALWFPGIILDTDMHLTFYIMKIITSTQSSKNRVKQIDGAVYKYYTKSVIEKMKKQWRKLNMPEFIMRILHQAVQAYHRKEYAITVIVLSTQWEGIIYRKAHDDGRKKTEKTKKYLSELAEKNNYLEIISSYYNEFIMYNCNSVAETIKDVPGRNSAAHCFYKEYPTRKAALNAILFTNFLLNLEAL